MTLIEVKNVIKTYYIGGSLPEKRNFPASGGEEGFNALDNVSLKIECGEFVAIMGASGSGKSTFMNMLGCLDTPTSGTYLLDDIDTSTLNKDELSEIRNAKLGFVFQGFNLIARTTALENVEVPMIYKGIHQKERLEQARKALKIVGLESRENHTPNQMSGGQQQRVAIARAIVNDAPIILADEPTGNLDTKTSVEIMEFLVKLNEGTGATGEAKKTIILVTHEEDIAQYAKRVVRFKDGKIISDETKKRKENGGA